MKLPSIENFRDFGGYPARAGVLARGVLYRSANHSYASDGDLARVRQLGLATIVDLRRPSERLRYPSRRWHGFDVEVIVADHEFEGTLNWDDFLKRSDHSAATFRAYLEGFYREAPFAPRHVELFSRYFERLAQAKGPVLIHCAGGKDRTGIACALTHVLAGVHEDDLMADFLATNDPQRIERVGPAWAQAIGHETGRTPRLEDLAVAMSVEAGYLHAAFEAIRARHGSVEAYLERALGIDSARRAAIESHILV